MDAPNPIRAFLETEELADWRVLGEGACAFYPTGSFAEATRFIAAIVALEDVGDHPPAVDLRADGVTVRLLTSEKDYYGPGPKDLRQARAISELARQSGLEGDPGRLQTVQVTVDASVHADIMPFWRAVLGYEYRPDSPGEDLVDPRGRGPGFWFQQMDRARPQRNRMHIDVWVPHDQARARIDAAVAAGGRVLDADHAPAWWVLADPEGNEACISTASERG